MKNDPAEMCRKGMGLLEKGLIREAEGVFREALSSTTKAHEQGPLLYNLALCKYRAGDHAQAIPILEKALSVDKGVRRTILAATELPLLKTEPAFAQLASKYRPPNVVWRVGRPLLSLIAWALIVVGSLGLLFIVVDRSRIDNQSLFMRENRRLYLQMVIGGAILAWGTRKLERTTRQDKISEMIGWRVHDEHEASGVP